jgi:ATP-binding cassette subfamily A (ABC1) protein 3
MLCGLYSPSSGTAKILGHDIRTHMDKIRSSIGFCPQANILFDELTVSQHLDLVASVRNFIFFTFYKYSLLLVNILICPD